jgi:hypothetical protein
MKIGVLLQDRSIQIGGYVEKFGKKSASPPSGPKIYCHENLKHRTGNLLYQPIT